LRISREETFQRSAFCQYFFDGDMRSKRYYCDFVNMGLMTDHVSIHAMAVIHDACFIIDGFGTFFPFQMDVVGRGSIRQRPKPVLPTRGFEWKEDQFKPLDATVIATEFEKIKYVYDPPREPDFQDNLLNTTPESEFDKRYTVTPPRAAMWWLRHYDGWAVSTLADSHAVQNAGLSVMSPVYLNEMLPYLLLQHRALWCPRAKNTYDRHFANVLYLLTNFRVSNGPVSSDRDRVSDDYAFYDECMRSLQALYPNSKWRNQVKFELRWAAADREATNVVIAAYPPTNPEGRPLKIRNKADLSAWNELVRAATSDAGQTQRLLRAMAVIDDQEGTIAAAMRVYARTESGQESLCVAQNFTEVTPRFAAARATVIEAVNHLWAFQAPPGNSSTKFTPDDHPEIYAAAGPVPYNEEWASEATIVRTRMFAPAMIAAGAILAHERYSAGYSDPRGLSSAKTQFDRAVSAIAGELNKRRRRR
ncbi:MAG: hypothetical protein ACPGR8_17410, partial [Limisphaerales bacterium]